MAISKMESPSPQSSPFLRRSFNSSPPLRINTSPSARQSPKIIASPTSPTKSIAADIFRMSGASEASTALQSSQRHFDNDEGNDATLPSEASFSKDSVDLLPEEQRPGHYVTRSLSFFDISDSSEVSGTSREDASKSSTESQRRRTTHVSSREDSSVSTVRPFENTTRLNSKTSDLSKTSKTSKNTNLTDSQIDRYMSAHYVTPIKEDATQHETMNEMALPGQALTTDNRHSRPISDFSFNNNYTLKQSNRLSGLTNASANASLSGDRVLQTYSAMLHLMREAEQSSNPVDNKNNMDMSMISSAVSPAHVPLSLSTAFEQPRPAPIITQPQPQTQIQTSPLNPHAETFRMTAAQPASLTTSFSSPGEPKRKDRHVSLRPPPLKSSPLRSTFVPPSMYTPFPIEAAKRSSFPLSNRHSGWQRLGDDAAPPQRPRPTLTVKLKRRHSTKVAQLPLPCPLPRHDHNSEYNQHPNAGEALPLPRATTPINFSRATSPTPTPYFIASTTQQTANTTTTTPDERVAVENNEDDEAFFLSLRHLYHSNLLGRSRLTRWLKQYISARKLVRVRYVPDPLAAMMMLGQQGENEFGVGVGQASSALGDEELMTGFCRPRGGRGAFGVVKWACSVVGGGVEDAGSGIYGGGHDIVGMDMNHVHTSTLDKSGTSIQATPVEMLGDADAQYPPYQHQQHQQQQPTTPQPHDTFWPPLPPPLSSTTTQHSHIELEEGWAIRRILLAVLVVLVATVAMVVVWTTLGVGVGVGVGSDGDGGEGHGGGRLASANGRVQEAFVMGLLVLAVGCVDLAVWLGISWAVM